MLVTYKRIINNYGNTVGATIVEAVVCCSIMDDAIYEERIISMKNNHYPDKEKLTLNMHNEDCSTEYLPITFCPFCGKKIKTKEVGLLLEIEKTRRKEEIYYEYELFDPL